MTYARLGIREFGEHLLKTNDLDPVYVALVENRERWATVKLHRWLVAYWCYYDCGVASYLSELDNERFWTEMMCAAVNSADEPSPLFERWPRASERRHFRGKAATSSVLDLKTKYGPWPETMITEICAHAPSYAGVAKAVATHRGFGPWISFKVADMLDRVLGVHVDFTEAAVFMFKDPVRAAEMVFKEHMMKNMPDESAAFFKIKKDHHNMIIRGVVDHLTSKFSGFLAPPFGDRPVGLQEVETILCKWKSHMNGHYPLGNDTREIKNRLRPWAKINCKTAYEFLEKMPDEH